MRPKNLADWLLLQECQHALAIDLGLDRVSQVATRLGVDKFSGKTITVAGTNGKGSSTAMLSSIYATAGYRVGWYSSPHLLTYSERVKINGIPVSDDLLVQAFEAIDLVREQISLTYFEWGTLAALWIFRHQACDIQILEVGLGGRLDAVNLVDCDAALITAIDVDHTAWLGSDRECIGYEKAGILRSHAIAVTSDPNPPKRVLDYAKALGITLRHRGEFFDYDTVEDTWRFYNQTLEMRLSKPGLVGAFQLDNAAGVVDLVTQMQTDCPLLEADISKGLAQTQLLGRLQWQKIENQDWLLDVAHNPQSVQALASYLKSLDRPVVAVFSALSDKDIRSMVSCVMDYVQVWYVADLHHERAADKSLLLDALAGQTVYWFDDVAEACDAARHNTSSAIRLIFGSFVTVEQGLQWMKKCTQ